MPLKLVTRGRYYYLRGTVCGQYIYETTGLTGEQEAEAVRIKREAEILERSVYGPAATVTFREAAVVYCETVAPSGTQRDIILGRKTKDGSLGWNLVDAIGDKKLQQIDQTVIDEIARTRFAGASAATIQRQLITPVSAVMRKAARRKWCAEPHFERPRVSESRVRWLTPDEATVLLDAAADHLRPLLVFLLGTGARLSEALDLEWADIELSEARCHFWRTKGGASRIARLPPSAVTALANLDHDEGMVFLNHQGKPYVDRKRESGGQIKTAFRGACRRADIENATPHTLRHTWASWFYAASKDPLRLRTEGGWKSLSQVERYAHLVPARMLPGIRRIWGGEHPAIRAESVQSSRDGRKNVV